MWNLGGRGGLMGLVDMGDTGEGVWICRGMMEGV
jgi:hypothetical protein